jgi:NADH-quinone oxidoreductase subunit N
MRSPSELVSVTRGGAGLVTPGGHPVMAGGSPEADEAAAPDEPARDAEPEAEVAVGRRLGQWEVTAVAVVCAAATVFFGIYPSPLFDVARDAGAALVNLL